MARYALAVLLLAITLAIIVPSVPSAEIADGKEARLKYVTMNDIAKIFTPGREKKRLTSSIDLPNGEGRGIACSITSSKVEIDTDLDGKPDTSVAVNGKVIELTIKKGEKPKMKYAIYVTSDDRFQEKQWLYESAAAVTGTVAGTKVTILDDNCNGSFADYGKDGLLVGNSKAGWFLSSSIALGKNLATVDVDPDGESLTYSEFTGDTGSVDPFKKLNKADFTPEVFVVRQEDYSFSVISEGKKLMQIPTGRYTIERGVIDDKTEFVGGLYPPFDVLKGNTTVIEWGGPFTMSFFEKPSAEYEAVVYGTSGEGSFKGRFKHEHMFYMEPPYIRGEKGEIYVGSAKWCTPEQPIRRPTNQNEQGVVQFFPFPPSRISYQVEILDVKTRKSINHEKFYTGNQPAPNEQTAAPYYWNPFIFDYGDHRGKYILRITTMATKIFKDAVYEKAIELK